MAEDGRPLRDVKVSFTLITERGIRVSRWSADANASGEYLVSNVPEGNFQDHEDSLGNRRRSREIYYPGTDNIVQANVIALAPGVNLRDIDIAVPLNSLLLIDGTLLRQSSDEAIEAYVLGAATPLGRGGRGRRSIQHTELVRGALRVGRARRADGGACVCD
jgi:hypothetical protein